MKILTEAARSHTRASGRVLAATAWAAWALGLAALLLFLHQASYGKWGDLLTDYGREVYLAWQMSLGKVLYRDVAHYFGPVSSLVNGWLFSLGTADHVYALQAANAVLAAAMCLLAAAFTRRFVRGPAAWLNAAFFLFFAGLSLGEGTARNHNFISPYSHELTHAILLSYLFFVTVDLKAVRPGLNGLLSGLFLALAFYAKSEVFVALAAATAALVLHARLYAGLRPASLLAFGAGLAGSFGAVSLALAAFYGERMGLREYLSGIALMYLLPFHLPEPMKVYYMSRSGLGELGRNLVITLKAWGYVAAFFAAAAGANALLERMAPSGPARGRLSLAALCLVVTPLFIAVFFATSFTITYFLPTWLLLLAGLCLLPGRRFPGPAQAEDRPDGSLFFAHCVFALLMLSKVFFRPTISSYATFLLLPAVFTFTISCDLLARSLPAGRRHLARNAFMVTAAIVALAAYGKAARTAAYLASDGYAELNWENGRFALEKDRQEVVGRVVDHIRANKAGEDTLAVFPEGATLNYVLGMPNTTRYINVSPPEWQAFDGAAITRAYREAPPVWVVKFSRDNAVYGCGELCAYATDLCALLEGHYDVVLTARGGTAKEPFTATVYRARPEARAVTAVAGGHALP